MNSLRKWVGAVAVRIRSRTTDRPSQARPRRFRPLAEPMEARALLSQVALTGAMTDPNPTGHGAVEVVVNGLSPRGRTR
jgi:hypothetical protein